MNASRKVLGHSTAFDSFNTHPLQSLGESKKLTKTLLVDVFCDKIRRRSPKIAYFMRSLLPSSLPRCSRPLVHAKMLAIGLVLVGRP